MVDISNELSHIENDILGEDVRRNIGDALTMINTSLNCDISYELNIIYHGRYGLDIRMAIHDALKKLSTSAPTPQSVDMIAGYTVPQYVGVVTNICGATTVIEPEGE